MLKIKAKNGLVLYILKHWIISVEQVDESDWRIRWADNNSAIVDESTAMGLIELSGYKVIVCPGV